MSPANESVLLRGYPQTYSDRYGYTLTDWRSPGTTGACLLAFECEAGSYTMPPTTDFALTVFQNGGFTAEADLGTGCFKACIVPGRALLVPPNVDTIRTLSRGTKGWILSLAGSRVRDMLQGMDLSSGAGVTKLYSQPVCDPFISVGVEQLWSVSGTGGRSEDLLADATVLTIFAALARHAQEIPVQRKAQSGLTDWQLRRVVARLEATRAEDASLAELAGIVHLSAFYFARAFKQSTGLPPNEYRRRLRIADAKQLLARTALPVTEIAMRVGYGSSQALARVFRRDVGMAPHDYRRHTAANGEERPVPLHGKSPVNVRDIVS